MPNIAVIDQPRRSITADMAGRYGMEPAAFEATLRGTVVPKGATREEFAAFLMVAREYSLNPILKEIYAFPKKGGGIQTIVGVDGWTNIINSHPKFDGMTFEDVHDTKGNVAAITCRIYRKDRAHPVEATEYLAECKRNTEPWNTWPRRMLRHKAMIQAARYAFGFAGIIDEDEADRIAPTPVAANGPPRRLTQQPAEVEGEPVEDVLPEDYGEEPQEVVWEDEARPAMDAEEEQEPTAPRIDPESPDYKRGWEDRKVGVNRCLKSEIRNDEARLATWKAGWEAAKADEAP